MIKNLTVVLISHKSKKKVINFIKKLSGQINIIVIENSDDNSIKEDLNKIKNVELIFSQNNGYGSAINLARKSINTDYFIVFNPDVNGVDGKVLKKFIDIGKSLNDNYACIGPRYINISKKTLIQSNEDKEISTLPSISGASMFFNKKNFDLLNGFDENFFLYFEETDYCLRAKKIGLKSYQINTIKLKHDVGTSTIFKNDEERQKMNFLYSWHFIWSKFYFFKKHYGFLISIIYFFPILIRTQIKIIFFKIVSKNKKKKKYEIRYDGLISSIKGIKAYKRINNF